MEARRAAQQNGDRHYVRILLPKRLCPKNAIAQTHRFARQRCTLLFLRAQIGVRDGGRTRMAFADGF